MAATISSASSVSSVCRPMPNEFLWRRPRALLLRIFSLGLLSLAGCQRAGANGKPWLEFSGTNALAHVQALVDLGPRPAASAALEKARAYIRQNLESCGWTVAEQRFSDQTPRGAVSFVNLIATRPERHSRGEPRFLVCSHYDTKSFDDIVFVGANDGGSSTGALLELARVLSLHSRLAGKVELIFFDGE